MTIKERESIQTAEAAQAEKVTRPPRIKLTAEETRLRMEAFEEERKEALIAAVRKDKD